MSRLILAYDLGTGGNKAFLFDEIGNCDASTFVPFETSYPEPGWYEQRPMDWWDAVVQSTKVKRFFEGFDEGKWYRMTGNGFSRECYPSFKIMWYRDNEPALYGRCSKILGSKDFINFKLTGQMLTDYSYASGSGVYELTRWNYSSALIQASDLDPGLFPDIVPSTHVLGKLSREASDTLNIPSNVFVVCGGVDNSCMALGAGDIAEGGCISHLAHRHGLPYPPKNQSSIQR
jgi:xylulokinase